ncbi:MAG: hypothetical protein U0350_03770 [Caldilineaceae bacterium]
MRLTYIARAACAWRLFPHDFLPWQTVYGYFAAWQCMHAALREAEREQAEHEAAATVGSLDRQSVKTMNADANGRGFDGAKLVTGRKRFILVNTLGWLLQVVVTSAKTSERNGTEMLFFQTPDEILAHLELVGPMGLRQC